MWLLDQVGVLTLGEAEPVALEEGWPVLARALTQALEKLVAQQEAEGQFLLKEVMALHEQLGALADRMGTRVPEALARRQATLRERLKTLLGEVTLDEGRLAMEVSVWAEKTDISEELVRLSAHLEQSAALLRGGGSVGRPLDFLVQEMNREVNTVASKADDLDLSKAAITAKGILEKIREQIQNLE